MVFRFMESRESSDILLVSGCPGYDNDQEQDAVTIPIKSRILSVVEGYTKENGVTVVNFNKSKQIVCEICSLTLKSMKGLESHKKAKHSDDGTCFYCSECGISKDTKKQLQNHQRRHKTVICPPCNNVLSLWD